MVASNIIKTTFLPLKLNLANPKATAAEIKTSPKIFSMAINTVFAMYLKIGIISKKLDDNLQHEIL